MMLSQPNLAVLAFFQGTQLNLFERFLTRAVSGISATGITSGMQNVAYVVLLVSFLWQVYQSAMQGGDVRGLGTSLIKYVITAIVVMNYTAIFTTVNQGFVNGGDWIGNASNATNLFDNWKTDLQNQFNQFGYQNLWGIVTGDIAGLIDGLLIIIAYLLYPIVIVIFGFFYIFYGAVLYIFGPVVIALMPLGVTNRISKAYIENVFIWNSWPILYGGFGALLSAVQMGQIGQMLHQNSFLGGLGNIEGSVLIGIASMIYSVAIAMIPFIAKRIISGDVGHTAAAIIGAAATAVTLGAAAVEGAAVGAGASSTGAASSSSSGNSASMASVGRFGSATVGSDQPTPGQQSLRATTTVNQSPAASSASTGWSGDASGGKPTLESHAEQMRGSIGEVMSVDGTSDSSISDGLQDQQGSQAFVSDNQAPTSFPAGLRTNPRPSVSARRGPTVHRYNIGTWSAFHAARIATHAVASVTTRNE